MDTTKTIAALFDFDGVIMDTELQYTIFWNEQGEKYLHVKNFGSPATAPDNTAATVIVNNAILDSPVIATIIGIKIPKVPQEVPVAKDSPTATKKRNTGSKVAIVVLPLTKVATYPPRSR